MRNGLPADLLELEIDLDAAERDARRIITGLPTNLGSWHPEAGSWSVAECLEHIALSNRAYLAAMHVAAEQARSQNRLRRGPARPGLFGSMVVRSFEPGARTNVRPRAPREIVPREAPPLDDAFAAFLASQDELRTFVRQHADLDLAGVTFPNPFIRGIRFSLATGLHLLTAHTRRHLEQARRARAAAEAAGTRSPAHAAQI